jgi:hypothetical protein
MKLSINQYKCNFQTQNKIQNDFIVLLITTFIIFYPLTNFNLVFNRFSQVKYFNWTKGCVFLRRKDVDELYDAIPVNRVVVIKKLYSNYFFHFFKPK